MRGERAMRRAPYAGGVKRTSERRKMVAQLAKERVERH